MEPYIDLVGDKSKNIKLIAHPQVFDRKFCKGLGDVGTRKRKSKIAKYFVLNLSKKPKWITNNLCFLGEIPRINDFEAKIPCGMILKNGKVFPDYLVDDSALVYKSSKGLVIIPGCSHAGICNIIEYSKQICRETKIIDVVGGFHLLDVKKGIMSKTIEYLESCEIKCLHPCHCTDLQAKIELGKYFLIKEVGSGLILEYE
jgi:7,8-dihydropterin-6-yl-methyl-4-(beta-D-ribofuranosyl)aminobenzene 5'-phosphate synthase